MADELKVQLSLSYSKDGTKINKNISDFVSVTGSHPVLIRQNVGTSEEDLSNVDAGNSGFMFIKNMDSSNYVEYSRSTATGTGSLNHKLSPGEFNWVRLNSTGAIKVKADTAACDVEAIIFPN